MEFKSAVTAIDTATNYTSITSSGLLTPPNVAAAYGIPVSTGVRTKIGIVSLGGGFLTSDLTSSLTDLGLTTPTITTVLLDGATGTFSSNPASPDYNGSVENTIDLYCVASMAPSANIVLYITPGNTTTQWQNAFNRAIEDNCDVISFSWYTDESYGDFLDSTIANATTKNISVFVASGDIGSEISPGVLGVNYPSTNANVTAVGGTNLILNPNGSVNIEYPSNRSGGGISTIVPVPGYQQDLTYNTYISGITGPTTPLPMRGVPDISSAMYTHALYFNGTIIGVQGTSISAPTMAGMTARFISLNNRRPRQLNPMFYGNTSAFNDWSGNYHNDYNPSVGGYLTSIAWDPVTGLGTPNGQAAFSLYSAGTTKIKTSADTWAPVANVYVKTGTNTWGNVRAIYTKTINGWQQTY